MPFYPNLKIRKTDTQSVIEKKKASCVQFENPT